MITADLILTRYAQLFLFILICFVLGRWVLKRFAFRSAGEGFVYSLAVGMGLVAYSVFFTGLLQILYAWVLALVLGSLLVVAFLTTPEFTGALRSFAGSWRGLAGSLLARKDVLVFFGLLALIFGSSLTLPLYPPYDWDTIEYHLVVAKIYANSHGLVLTEFLRYPVYSQLLHMLFTLMLVFAGDSAVQLLQYLFYGLTGGLIYFYSRKIMSRRGAMIAAVLWLSNKEVLYENHHASIDLGMIFFGTAGVFAFLNYLKDRQFRWLALAGGLLGLAAAVKYTALFWIGLCGLYALWLAFRERNWRLPVQFGLLAGLVACPFYLRNLYYTGNPFFPYISLFFRENIWTFQDFALLAHDQASFGVPRTLVNFLKLPWTLRSSFGLFHSQVSPYHDLFQAFLPVTLVAGTIKPSLRHLLVFGLGFTGFWFLGPQVLRYLVPAFPLFCVLAGGAFDSLVDLALGLVKKVAGVALPQWLPTLCALVVIAWTTFLTVRFNGKTVETLGPLPVTQAQREEFLTRLLPSYPAYKMLNALEGASEARLYALYDEDKQYYSEMTFMGDWFGPARFSDTRAALSDGQKLYEHLTGLGADYFLFRGGRVQGVELPDDAYFAEKFKEIYNAGGVQVFEILK